MYFTIAIKETGTNQQSHRSDGIFPQLVWKFVGLMCWSIVPACEVLERFGRFSDPQWQCKGPGCYLHLATWEFPWHGESPQLK